MSNARYHIFNVIYLFGIPVALIIGISGGNQLLQQRYGIPLPDYSGHLLEVSLSHMAILVFLALKHHKVHNTAMGEKIQTAGYLHTLIGFTASLFRIDPDNFTLISILIPLGSALMTSIKISVDLLVKAAALDYHGQWLYQNLKKIQI